MLPSRGSGEEGRCRRAHWVVLEAEELAMVQGIGRRVALVDLAPLHWPGPAGPDSSIGKRRSRDGALRFTERVVVEPEIIVHVFRDTPIDAL